MNSGCENMNDLKIWTRMNQNSSFNSILDYITKDANLYAPICYCYLVKHLSERGGESGGERQDHFSFTPTTQLLFSV